MSITPFRAGLPTPVPTDGAPAATDQSGEPGVVFGDALAAALLATVPLPTTPAPAPSLETTGPDAGAGLLASLPAASPEVSRLIAGAAAPVVEVRGAPAPSLETTGPEAGSQPLANLPAASPEVSRLVAGAPHTSTTEELVAGILHASATAGLVAGASHTATAGAPTVERAVVQQVFPEVTRLVTSTPTDRPGTHRITLTLQPEQLGEVRVTLVVKDGAVQVRLAGNANDLAGSAAVHRALSSGVLELQRLLERAGATEARVLVRDPFSPTAPQPTAPNAPVAATSQPGGSTVSADAGREGASAQNRWSGDSDQRRQRRDVPETPLLAPVGTPTTAPTTTPSGQLDRTL
ncbi:flagellar hook-length control protein FliK [Nocardioides daeguensis]|uniref:Flagellar hook-length control protein-like C-terminal domain-containing protein n=1 Tax=Nocardioides daeguensis TaxID=908359 RepID=A0ABP6VCF9_9ACTN|nr:flagellar hook-length control protein FliK [Nocardioides daeguensis]MBV6726129.1 flagellar hook-length control protein FliK [Nocardioides daeguensis]MCR1771972.1 flagellar hook-length control protein FliK [Nocardioides daeguensis]